MIRGCSVLETCIDLMSLIESHGVDDRKHNATYKDHSEVRRIDCVCLVVSLVAGLQPLEAILINPFEWKPNGHTEHGHEHRKHEQH